MRKGEDIDNALRSLRHHPSGHSAALDQLPRLRVLFRHHLEYCRGYSFYRDACLQRITRYRYNNVPLDGGGRYIYLRDDDIGEFWSPSWKPTCHELEGYTCGHGLGFTIISSTYKKIETETRYFIPWGESGEGV